MDPEYTEKLENRKDEISSELVAMGTGKQPDVTHGGFEHREWLLAERQEIIDKIRINGGKSLR